MRVNTLQLSTLVTEQLECCSSFDQCSTERCSVSYTATRHMMQASMAHTVSSTIPGLAQRAPTLTWQTRRLFSSRSTLHTQPVHHAQPLLVAPLTVDKPALGPAATHAPPLQEREVAVLQFI